jgi:hypothetical protein
MGDHYSHNIMGTPRYDCIAAVLPNSQLMVVGGYSIDPQLINNFVTILIFWPQIYRVA